MDWNNKHAVLTAVSNNGAALKYTVLELQADREVVLVAVSNYGYALEYASSELRADRVVVLATVSNKGHALEYASPELRADREVVLAALSNFGRALQCSPELQADREVVLTAVNNDIKALKYASPELRVKFRNKTREQINELLTEQSKVYINKEEKDEECPICLENYGKNRLIKLNCGHIIHFECWNQWKKHKSSCPLCRAKQP